MVACCDQPPYGGGHDVELYREHSIQLNRAMWRLCVELGLVAEGQDSIDIEPDEIIDQTLLMMQMYKRALTTMRRDWQAVHDITSKYGNIGINAKGGPQDG